jgi:hypothetical protein
MSYLENMSTVDVNLTNAAIQGAIDLIQVHGQVISELIERRRVQCFTFTEILEAHNATGCEVLMIDAEGWDCAIIRSVIYALQKDETGFVWPHLIHFESCGHANTKENDYNTEENTIIKLQQSGYLLLYAGMDSTLAYGESLESLPRFSAWVDKHFKLTCCICGFQTVPSHQYLPPNASLGYKQWRGAPENGSRHMPNGMWTCKWCMNPLVAQS